MSGVSPVESGPGVVADLAVRRSGLPLPSPVVVLLHANGDSGDCWPDLVTRWADRAHLVAVDLRGHGRSPRFTPEQLVAPGDVVAEDTVRLLRALRTPGRPLVAVGHSLGGAALTAACAEQPGLVDALVLIDPPWDTPSIVGNRPEVGAERVLLVTEYARDPEGELRALRQREPRWPDAERRAWVASKADVDLAYLATGGGRPSTPWTDHVPRLSAPTLVVTGDEEVIVGPRSRSVVDALGNHWVTVVILPGVGHYVRQGDPDGFHSIVDPWLRLRLTPAASLGGRSTDLGHT